MTENVVLSDGMATEYFLGNYRANGKVSMEPCLLTSSGDGWLILINEHYLYEKPNDRYAAIYGTPCFVYKSGTQFHSKDTAIECFNDWLDVGRTAGEEQEAMMPEWEEFARRNKENKG